MFRVAGIGELFAIRTTGSVIDDYALGSVEYGAEHLGAKLELVLGHIGCGGGGACRKCAWINTGHCG